MKRFQHYWAVLRRRLLKEQRELERQDKQWRMALHNFDSILNSIIKKKHHG